MHKYQNLAIAKWFHDIVLRNLLSSKSPSDIPIIDDAENGPYFRIDHIVDGNIFLNRGNGTSVMLPDFDRDYPNRLLIATEFKKFGKGDPNIDALLDLPEPDRKEAFREKHEEQVALLLGLPPGSRVQIALSTNGATLNGGKATYEVSSRSVNSSKLKPSSEMIP